LRQNIKSIRLLVSASGCQEPLYLNSNQIKTIQIELNQIKSNRIKSNRIKSNQIKSNQIKSNQIKSNQIKSNQIKSNQIKSNRATKKFIPSPLKFYKGILGIFMSKPLHRQELEGDVVPLFKFSLEKKIIRKNNL